MARRVQPGASGPTGSEAGLRHAILGLLAGIPLELELLDSRSALRGEASGDLAVPAFGGVHGLQRQGFELVGEVA
jgi:hypothetical protein